MQIFPVHIVLFLGIVYEDSTLFESCCHILFLTRTDKWLRHFYKMDVEAFLVLNASNQGITVST